MASKLEQPHGLTAPRPKQPHGLIAPRSKQLHGPPMTLGNMRQLGGVGSGSADDIWLG